MPLPANPPKIADAPFASMRGHHIGIRYPDFEKARAFWVDTMGWRVLQTWPYGDLTLAYVMPPNQDDFHLEILAGAGAAAQTVFGDVDASLSVNGYNHMCLSVDSVDETTFPPLTPPPPAVCRRCLRTGRHDGSYLHGPIFSGDGCRKSPPNRRRKAS